MKPPCRHKFPSQQSPFRLLDPHSVQVRWAVASKLIKLYEDVIFHSSSFPHPSSLHEELFFARSFNPSIWRFNTFLGQKVLRVDRYSYNIRTELFVWRCVAKYYVSVIQNLKKLCTYSKWKANKYKYVRTYITSNILFQNGPLTRTYNMYIYLPMYPCCVLLLFVFALTLWKAYYLLLLWREKYLSSELVYNVPNPKLSPY